MTLTRYLELHEQCFNKDCLKDFLNKLRFLHQQGFIISDSKPDNFLVQITPLSLKPILVRIDFDLDTQYLNELSVSPIAALKCYIFDIVQTLFFNFTAIIDGKQLLSNTHIETDACEEIIEQAHVLYCLHVEYKEEFLLVFEDDLITNKDIILDNATLPTSSSPSQITYLSRIAAITDELEVKINSLEHELAQLCATQQTNQSNDANNTKDALQHSDTITHDEYNSIKDLKISLGKFYKISKHLFAPQTVNMDIFLKSLSDDTCYNYSESVRKLFCIEHIKQAANIDLYTFFELSIDTSTPYTKADFIRSGIGKSPYVSRLLFAALEDDIQLSLRTIMSTIVNFSDGGAFMVIQWRLFKISNRLFTEDMRPIKELRTYNDDGDVVYEVPCYDEIIDGCTE